MKKYCALLSLGSNLGDRLHSLQQALDAIEGLLGEIVAVSSVYETAPWGFESANAFYNAAVRLQTSCSPSALMAKITSIERDLGKKPGPAASYRDRHIDIDIIYFEDWQLRTPQLQLPHPRRAQRRFVLLPLVEIAADFVDPEWGIPLAQLSEKTQDRSRVEKLEGRAQRLLSRASGE